MTSGGEEYRQSPVGPPVDAWISQDLPSLNLIRLGECLIFDGLGPPETAPFCLRGEGQSEKWEGGLALGSIPAAPASAETLQSFGSDARA